MTYDLPKFLRRAIAFSRATFGPGARTEGVIKHIRKELEEIENAQDPQERAKEWVDIIVLGFYGLWRELHYNHRVPWFKLAIDMTALWRMKQDKNEQRDWPDWRGNDGTTPIEHIRGGEHD